MSDVIIIKLNNIFDFESGDFFEGAIACLKMLLSRFSHSETLVVLIHDRSSPDVIDAQLIELKRFQSLIAHPEKFLLIHIIVRLSQLLGKAVIAINDRLELLLKHGFYPADKDLGVRSYEAYLQYYELIQFEHIFSNVTLQYESLGREAQFNIILNTLNHDFKPPYRYCLIKKVLTALSFCEKNFLNLELASELTAYQQQINSHKIPKAHRDEQLQRLYEHSYLASSEITTPITLQQLRSMITIDPDELAARACVRTHRSALSTMDIPLLSAEEQIVIAVSSNSAPPCTPTGHFIAAVLSYLNEEYPITVPSIEKVSVYYIAPQQYVSDYDCHPTQDIGLCDLKKEKMANTCVGHAHVIEYDPHNIRDSIACVSKFLSRENTFATLRFFCIHHAKDIYRSAYSIGILLLILSLILETYDATVDSDVTRASIPGALGSTSIALGSIFHRKRRQETRRQQLLVPNAPLILPAAVRVLMEKKPICSTNLLTQGTTQLPNLQGGLN